MTKRKCFHLFADILFFAIFVALDQITKYRATMQLKDKPAFIIWDGVFELNYLENRGAAFGMFQNQKFIFLICASIMIAAIIYTLIKMPLEKKYRSLEIVLVFLSAGAVGNMIDRVRTNYVVDFIYFKFISFPIFNMADIYVSLSCVFFAILILFYYKENDFAFMKLRKKKENQSE